MTTGVPIAGAILLTVATPGFAHRVDEYLQAATILVSSNRVQVQMRLVPGVAVLPTVLADLDVDGNGVISELEQRGYAERVLGDVSLTVDGERLPIRLASSSFASIDELRRGLGENYLEFDATLPAAGGNRRIVFENTHHARIAAYLVNALVPKDPRIRITGQNRDYIQSSYALDFTQAAPGTRFISLGSLLRLALLLCGALALSIQLVTRRRHARQVLLRDTDVESFVAGPGDASLVGR